MDKAYDWAKKLGSHKDGVFRLMNNARDGDVYRMAPIYSAARWVYVLPIATEIF